MGHGLDQYLANRLTNAHLLQVVTDPTLADVILTEQIGEGFQAKLETISPTPKPEEPEKPAAPAKDDKDAKGDKDAKSEKDADAAPAGPANPFLTEPENKVAPVGLTSSFARNKGVIFLVDAKSRQVLWSTFEPSRSAAIKELDRTASGIVNRLKKDMKRK
jgi:hypothetical protein